MSETGYLYAYPPDERDGGGCGMPVFCTPRTPKGELAHRGLQDAWVELLLRFHVQWFCTMTFRNGVGPESGNKQWRKWVNDLNCHVSGKNWRRRGDPGVYWIRADEFQRRGALHYHALVGTAGDINDEAKRLHFKEVWFAMAGICRIEAIRDAELVRKYVSKYVTKGGEIELSDSLLQTVQLQKLDLPKR